MFGIKTKQMITFLMVGLFMTACQTTSNETKERVKVITTDKDPRKGECKYIQRNLTVSWKKRSYWCAPK